MAARLGHAAVEALIDGKSDVCVNMKNGNLEFLPLEIAVQPKAWKVLDDYRLLKVLA